MILAFSPTESESYRRRFRCLFLCSRDVYGALINSLRLWIKIRWEKAIVSLRRRGGDGRVGGGKDKPVVIER